MESKNNLNKIEELHLTFEERKLISNLNKNIKSLQIKTDEYLNAKGDLNINTESAFIFKYEDSKNILELKNIINEFNDAIFAIESNEIDLKIKEKSFPNLLKSENISLIKNTLNEYNNFYLKTLKQEALNIFSKLNLEKNKEKIDELNKKYKEILLILKEKVNDKDVLVLESLKNDYKLLFSLKSDKKYEFKISLAWKFFLLAASFIIILLFILILVFNV
ncbi:MAG: hypothetical protein HPAVJP_1770 [Candidatus Hepatoplasma vulgare]|nr:MAG: hypothetical protein HPAVJP_1770 [Candidatus Hepatoplasma sp.]